MFNLRKNLPPAVHRVFREAIASAVKKYAEHKTPDAETTEYRSISFRVPVSMYNDLRKIIHAEGHQAIVERLATCLQSEHK